MWLKREGEENVRVARRKGKIAGGLIAQPMGLWFGGQSVPMASVRAVGVAPEHRSAGVASALMRTALREMFDTGVPLSALFPATQPVYRRPGFEQAGVRLLYQMPTAAIDVRDRSLDVRLAEESDHATIRSVYQQRARSTSGNLDRSDWVWQRILNPPAWAKPVEVYLVERDGTAEGYTVVAQKEGTALSHLNHLELSDVVALTQEAGRRLLTFFADHRSMAEDITWSGPPVDPWLFPLAEQTAKIVRRLDWMLRIVNVPAALEARGYAPDLNTELHLEVSDNVLPENHGRWVLAVADGRGKVTKGGHGSVRIDVRGLATLYTGHLSPQALKSTGYVEGTDQALNTASLIFAGPAPWMPDIF